MACSLSHRRLQSRFYSLIDLRGKEREPIQRYPSNALFILILTMSSKVELQRKLNEIGYEYGPFASKDTLSNVMRLHSVVRSLSLVSLFRSFFVDQAVESKGINVAELNDHDLRKSLTESNHTVGPVTSRRRGK